MASGDFTIPCPGEPFLEPIGEKFVEETKEADADTNGLSEIETNVVGAYEGRKDASKAFDLTESSDSSITFEDETSNPEFSNVQRDIVEIQTDSNTQKVRPPQLVPLNSTEESLTWQLEGLDPKIRIDKYQVIIRVKLSTI